MKIACLSFTEQGERIALTLKTEFEGGVDCFSKGEYKENLERFFEEYEGIVFISSTGIAVRLSAPFLKDKKSDPAIVVVDDMSRFSISLVSGHIGGANQLAEDIGAILGCTPVITTASDGRGFEAIDLFAKKNTYEIEDFEVAKKVTAMMVENRKILFTSPFAESIDYPNLADDTPDGCILVTHLKSVEIDVPTCILRPKSLFVGIGCRKNKPVADILKAIKQVFTENNLSIKSLKSMATIELKKDEPGLIEASKVLGCGLEIFNTDEISKVQHLFEASGFVEEQTGVTAVCEPCAFLAGDEIIVRKQVIDGITISVSKILGTEIKTLRSDSHT